MMPLRIARQFHRQSTLTTMIRSIRRQTHRCLSAAAASVPLASQEYSITIGGVRSQPTNPIPIVIAHGLLGSSTNWRSFVNRSEFVDHRVIGVDLRNHGSSPHTPTNTLPEIAADIHHFITDLNRSNGGDRGIDLIGHSLGGRASMLTALQHPESIHRLIVADMSPVTYDSTHRTWAGVYQIVAALKALDLTTLITRAEADRALTNDIPDKSVRSFVLSNLVPLNTDHGGTDRWKWRVNLIAIQQSLQAIGSFSYAEAAKHANGPFKGRTLFLGGGRSEYIKPAYHSAIYELFPNAEIEMIDQSGHWLHVDRPNETAAAISRFLSKP